LSILFTLVSVGFFISAFAKSSFAEGREKPNSLVYFLNTDANSAYWATYDKTLDSWTENYLGKTPENASNYIQNAAGSKYGTKYTFASEAPIKDIPQPKVHVQKDTTVNGIREVTFSVLPQRYVNRITVFSDIAHFKALSFNGKEATLNTQQAIISKRSRDNILDYYVTDDDSLEISFKAPIDKEVRFVLHEISLDLLSNT